MTLRKLLAVLLCICAMGSVMVVVANATQNTQAQVLAQANNDVRPSEDEEDEEPEETTKSVAEKITEGWEKIKPYFDWIYKIGFQGLSQALVVGFQWLLNLVGLSGVIA